MARIRSRLAVLILRGGDDEVAVLHADAGRDRLKVQVRLDKVVLVVQQQVAGTAQAELTPKEARDLARMLEDAAAAAERTPSN